MTKYEYLLKKKQEGELSIFSFFCIKVNLFLAISIFFCTFAAKNKTVECMQLVGREKELKELVRLI